MDLMQTEGLLGAYAFRNCRMPRIFKDHRGLPASANAAAHGRGSRERVAFKRHARIHLLRVFFGGHFAIAFQFAFIAGTSMSIWDARTGTMYDRIGHISAALYFAGCFAAVRWWLPKKLRDMEHKAKTDPPVCMACLYDLSGHAPQADGCRVCPECGAAWKHP